MNIIVIGGGPAGILSAISAAKHGNNVTILEKNNTLGKKLLITGKGRCNITSSLDMSEFINNIPGNGRFLYSAFQKFTNQDMDNYIIDSWNNYQEDNEITKIKILKKLLENAKKVLTELKK